MSQMQLLPVLSSLQVCVIHCTIQHTPSSCCHVAHVRARSSKQPWCPGACICRLPFKRLKHCCVKHLFALHAPCLCSCIHGTWCWKPSASCSSIMHIGVHMPTHHPLLHPSARRGVCVAVVILLHMLLALQGLLLCLLQALGQTRGLLAGIEVCSLRIIHRLQAPKTRHASWLAWTLGCNCKHHCLCSSLCGVLDVHDPVTHSKLTAAKVYDGTPKHHVHPLSSIFAEWNSFSLNALSTASSFNNSLPACIACICFQ